MLRSFKKTIKKNGYFEIDQKNDERWLFQPYMGEPLSVSNCDLVPADPESDYNVTGIIDKINSKNFTIQKVRKLPSRY